MDIYTARMILGVSESASFEDIKKQHRLKARQLHPDVNRGINSSDFVLLSSAFSLLKEQFQV